MSDVRATPHCLVSEFNIDDFPTFDLPDEQIKFKFPPMSHFSKGIKLSKKPMHTEKRGAKKDGKTRAEYIEYHK